jgi:hypothetical protein
VLDVDGARPGGRGLLPDYFERAVQDVGGQPVAFTVLTEEALVRARQWFALREGPTAPVPDVLTRGVSGGRAPRATLTGWGRLETRG